MKAGDYIASISQAIKWSTLAKVGSTRVMRLTVLIPIIGSLLLFNSYVIYALTLSPLLLTHIGITTVPQDFTVTSLYYMYFGLCLLGVGSILFAFYCPDEIKFEPHIMEYVRHTEMSDTPVLAKANLQYILTYYFQRNPNGDSPTGLKSAELPLQLEDNFYHLILEMYMETEQSDVGIEDQGFWSSLYTGSGYPNVHEIAQMVWGNAKVTWAFTMPFRALSPKFAKDIAFVKYQCMDLVSFGARLAVSILYSVGFIILAIPSAITFIRLFIASVTKLLV